MQYCGVYTQTTVEVQLDINMNWGRQISSGAYVSNVKCMCTSVPGHISDCSEAYIKYICLHSCLISAHETIDI